MVSWLLPCSSLLAGLRVVVRGGHERVKSGALSWLVRKLPGICQEERLEDQEPEAGDICMLELV